MQDRLGDDQAVGRDCWISGAIRARRGLMVQAIPAAHTRSSTRDPARMVSSTWLDTANATVPVTSIGTSSTAMAGTQCAVNPLRRSTVVTVATKPQAVEAVNCLHESECVLGCHRVDFEDSHRGDGGPHERRDRRANSCGEGPSIWTVGSP